MPLPKPYGHHEIGTDAPYQLSLAVSLMPLPRTVRTPFDVYGSPATQSIGYFLWISLIGFLIHCSVSWRIPRRSLSILSGDLFPFALWLAFPASDYYENSVTMPNIQKLNFIARRRFGLGNPRLSTENCELSMLSDEIFVIYHILWSVHLDYRAVIFERPMTAKVSAYQFPFRCWVY
jgi:hypothetical protein